ncbi:MAG: molybdopterin-dependent oxidoreductase [Armatimonadetes bacterium]|nr:molybdopterin-dependent oxidoreductase [Armatimonadota bacterium]
MPTITIDGKAIECAPGKTIIEAATDNGIDIPHFCWHPALSVSGNCRMCLVEVEKNPKLAIACATTVAEGQVVHSNNARVLKAREAIMEFLLINHPLDCPICDEAGQCKLQDYAFSHGRGESRFVELKVHKDKRVELGPEVMFDGERCISCSRCIRFSDEVAQQPVLTFVQRGDHVSIETFPGTQLDNPYSMNVIDICPVGALTSRDFRFKARVWDMSFNPSICPGCSRGCNIDVGVRNNEILRLEPRTNMKVNTYWMCDAGRVGEYRYVNTARVEQPMVKRDGTQIPVSWAEAFAAVAERLRGVKPDHVAVIGSPYSTNEENYLLSRFAREIIGTQNIDFVRHNDPDFADTMLRTADRTPNTRGAVEVGVVPGKGAIGVDRVVEEIRRGAIKALYVLDQSLILSEDVTSALAQLELLVVHAWSHTQIAKLAHVVFPTSTYAEKEGTFINATGIVQHFTPAVVTKENERIMGMKMSRLDKFGAANDRWTQGPRRDARPAWQIIQSIARQMGAQWDYRWAEDIFEDMAAKLPAFRQMSYDALDTYMGIELGRGDRPVAPGVQYKPHDYRPQVMEQN